MTPEQISELVNHKLSEIMEVCDTCQIIITVYSKEDNHTSSLAIGSGNLYARIASCEEWIARQYEYNRDNARNQSND